MITWITVWVLTVTSTSESYGIKSHYQLTYSTQDTCLKQIQNHTSRKTQAQCNFQQVPISK